MHPDVIAQTNKVNMTKTDLVGTLQKRQHDVGRYETMKYFMQDDMKRLSWLVPLFNGGMVESYDGTNVYGRILFVSSSKLS